MIKSDTDVLIIGGGPAGSVAAASLIKEGVKVVVVEKTKFPRFVIGESLLPRCMDLLEEAGLLDAIKSCDFQVKNGAKFIKGDLSCDFNFDEQFSDSWSWTWQAPRADFDEALINKVIELGADVKFETSVEGIVFLEDKVETKIVSDNKESIITSKYIIDCSGYGRVLPRLLDLSIPSTLSPKSAFFTHIKDDKRNEEVDGDRIQAIILDEEVWAWVIPFSNGITSVGIVGDITIEEGNQESNFRKLIAKNTSLKKRFLDSDFVFEPKNIKGYSTKVKKYYGERFVLAGNSTEFLDPIFSSGVTFALESGALSAKLVARALKGEKVDWDTEYVDYLDQGIEVFRSYIDNWYDGTLHTIFFADDINPKIKEQICSVLAGYVWDKTNPCVKKHKKILKTLAKVIQLTKEME